ncbi:unnamed protein product [Leuciscus chuanchicus]
MKTAELFDLSAFPLVSGVRVEAEALQMKWTHSLLLTGVCVLVLQVCIHHLPGRGGRHKPHSRPKAQPATLTLCSEQKPEPTADGESEPAAVKEPDQRTEPTIAREPKLCCCS